MNKPTNLAAAAACALVFASLVAAAPAAQATETDASIEALETTTTLESEQAVDCGPSDTDSGTSAAFSDDAAIDDTVLEGECYILGLDGVDEGVSLSLPNGLACDGTEGPVAGLHFPAGTPRQFFALSGEEPVAFAFACASEMICLELTAETAKTGGGSASATSECSETTAFCESPPGSSCHDEYIGLNEPGPWHCHLYVHVKWYGGSAEASCSVVYA